MEPAQRQERIAEAKDMYLVISRCFDCVLRAREKRDAVELDDGREDVSSARSGVRVVAMVQAKGKTVLRNDLCLD